jgi:hypothetical protein
MEINNGGNNQGAEVRTWFNPSPKLEFTILKNKLNLEEVLSSDRKKRPSVLSLNWPGQEYENQNPGDVAAGTLLYGLHRSHVTIEEYKDTMPQLLEFAAKKDGGFDKDFIAVTLWEFDKVASKMELPNDLMLGSPDFDRIKNRREYFSRVYGRVEALKGMIWNNPAGVTIKQDRIQRANAVLAEKRPHFPHSIF